MEDILEYVQEILSIENETTKQLMANALLHYFYLPTIVGSINGKASGDDGVQVSLNTALYILNKTVEMIECKPFINALMIALFAREGPSRLVSPRFSTIIPMMGQPMMHSSGFGNQININLVKPPPTFSATWKYKQHT